MNSPFADFGHRLFVCYGTVRDRFVPPQGVPQPFDRFLHGHLGALGYTTRLYYSERGLYFQDHASRDHVISGTTPAVTPESAPARTERPSPLAPAPGGLSLRRRPAGRTPSNSGPAIIAHDGPLCYPDLNRLTEMLPTLRRLTAPGAPPVAVVFHTDHLTDFGTRGPAVEQFRGFLDTIRTLPPSRRAILIFVFGQELEQLADQLRHKPALDLLLNLDAQGQARGIARCVHLGAPERDEVRRLVHYYRLRHGLGLDWPTLDQSLLRLTAALKTGALDGIQSAGREAGSGRLLQLELALERLLQAGRRLDPDSVRTLTGRALETRSARQRFDTMIGLDAVKAHIRGRLKQRLHLAHGQRQDPEESASDLWRLAPAARTVVRGEKPLHLVLAGNPGTGKTTLARLIGEIYQEAGLLELGHTVEAKRADLVGGYVGQTALKTRACIERALGGVLFIDEAYSLVEGGDNDFGPEAITTLIEAMTNYQDRLCVIFAGYPTDMDRLVAANAGFSSRCTRLDLEDYGPAQLQAIFEQCVRGAQLPVVLDAELQGLLPRLFQEAYDQRPQNFSNARDIQALFSDMRTAVIEELEAPVATHQFGRRHLPARYQGYLQQIEASAQAGPLAALEALVGLQGVKRQVRELLDLIAFEQRRREESGTAARVELRHYLFLGNPGTGKTTVARLMAAQLKHLGLLKSARLTELTASELSGQPYLGQAEQIVRKRFMDAIGGVLFIDEAHQLAQPHSYGSNVLGALTPLLSGYANELVVIFAGYRDRMQAIYDIDPGLKRRFETILFEDFSAGELVTVFVQMAHNDNLDCSEPARHRLLELFTWMLANRTEGFGNAGAAQTIFQRAKRRLAQRLLTAGGALDRACIEDGDIPSPNDCGDLL
ncbi:AAA family ATPase [Allochromatium vinosum]|uniref:AAA family ATPase n=1 Tax=Allochromatium vinosum TaxID=1049 RepID=UPI00190444E1|nr:AAA family ATPase [Allochromatium vinosum]MBK1654882.1 hypothetical protein [Allochromatium vinosum]